VNVNKLLLVAALILFGIAALIVAFSATVSLPWLVPAGLAALALSFLVA